MYSGGCEMTQSVKGLAVQAGRSSFNPWNLLKYGRKGPAPQLSSVFYIHTVACTHTHTLYTHIHTHNLLLLSLLKSEYSEALA